jgi:hypothetical protein
MYKGEIMATYYKINKKGKIENTILAEKDFIESQPDKENYVRLITNAEEEFNSEFDFQFALNKPELKYNFKDSYKTEIISIEEPIYNFQKRKFKNPQPYPSWIWNEKLYKWEAPVTKPKEKVLVWNEEKQQWIEVEV